MANVEKLLHSAVGGVDLLSKLELLPAEERKLKQPSSRFASIFEQW